MNGDIWLAGSTVIAAAISSFSAWHARKAHKQVQSPNGQSTGQTIADIREDIRQIRDHFHEHVNNVFIHPTDRRRS